jgi:predicted O-linked N-acetylglucosamine transferase (SPINDLY family)
LEAIDYRLSDPYLDPPGADLSCYRERTIRLPHSYWCYQPGGPTPEIAALPAEGAGFVTFGCLNNFAKVSPAALDLWAEILQATPQSRLLLHAPAGSCREEVVRRFECREVSAERLEFVGAQPWDQYVRCVQRIDIGLDPFPYGGGITTCDALWMGAPVVTLSGKTAVGRGGCSILSNIGLPELMAKTPEQYVQIAVSLAADLSRLNTLHSSLRNRMEASPLRDAKRCARDIEAAYRQMWLAWTARP